jgi:putative inorganic carbon (HCO3(-)) transporter
VPGARLSQVAAPRTVEPGIAPWAGRVAVGAAAFAVGSVLGRAADPVELVILAGLGGLAVIGAIARPRWCLVAAIFLLVGYVPDVLAGGSSAHGLTAIVLAGALLRWGAGRERLAVPGELAAFAALALAYVLASLFATDPAGAAAETLDLVSYGAVVAMLMVLLDTPAWLRRAAWAVVTGVGLLALLAIVQQVTKTYGSSYAGFAGVLPGRDAMRSAGPLSPNPFGQLLATAAVLAFYLARIQSRLPARALAAALAVACVVAVVYTQSRASLIVLLLAGVAVSLLRGVRLRVLVAGLCGAIALGALLLPQGLQQRIGALSYVASPGGASLQDTSLRGRTSENLAGLQMWADHPLLGVGPDNFEVHYQTYSAVIGIDQRAQQRGAHNLYLESLAETGVLGTIAFLGVLWLALTGAWRARSCFEGRDALLGEGLFVALCTYLICAVTLHSAYARYEWIFLGLGLAAGRLARKPAR